MGQGLLPAYSTGHDPPPLSRASGPPTSSQPPIRTHTGTALLVTTLVLGAGFGPFAFASYMPNVNFGILTALILSTALVTNLLLLPTLLLRHGRNDS